MPTLRATARVSPAWTARHRTRNRGTAPETVAACFSDMSSPSAPEDRASRAGRDTGLAPPPVLHAQTARAQITVRTLRAGLMPEERRARVARAFHPLIADVPAAPSCSCSSLSCCSVARPADRIPGSARSAASGRCLHSVLRGGLAFPREFRRRLPRERTFCTTVAELAEPQLRLHREKRRGRSGFRWSWPTRVRDQPHERLHRRCRDSGANPSHSGTRFQRLVQICSSSRAATQRLQYLAQEVVPVQPPAIPTGFNSPRHPRSHNSACRRNHAPTSENASGASSASTPDVRESFRSTNPLASPPRRGDPP